MRETNGYIDSNSGRHHHAEGDVSKAKEDISSINSKVSTLQTDMTSAKQDISSRYTKTEVDNKLKNKVEVNDLESGRYGGDFYPLTGREAFYLWNLATTTAAANLYLNPDPAISSVLRSTSSIRYKHSVETIDSEHADLIFRMRPVWYRSQCENDRRDWGFYGLIAEEVGEIALSLYTGDQLTKMMHGKLFPAMALLPKV